MTTFTKTQTCPVCQGVGTAVYLEVGAASANRLQSFDCPGRCWADDAPGGAIIRQLLAAPLAE